MKPGVCSIVVFGVACALMAAILPGCGSEAATSQVHAAKETAESLPAEIDAALARAAAFLVARQSVDGAWRSDTYAPFREGDALTPMAILALQSLPSEQCPEQNIERGLRYLNQFVGEDGSVRTPPNGFAYSVYLAAGSILALGTRQDEISMAGRQAWLDFLRARQLAEQTGWQPGDDYYGGWSYAPDLPRKPAEGVPLNPLSEPNLSATVFALDAIHVAGDSPRDEVAKARRFIQRCQNFPPSGVEPTEFDDGGFYFLLADAVRNKAGIAGRDAQHQERIASYGSTTTDGLRGLLLCGVSSESARVAAAVQWLKDHFSATRHPGEFQVEAARNSAYYYYARSLALLLDQHRGMLEDASVDVRGWAGALAGELVQRQRQDGSWINDDVEVREDDPIVATSLALAALAACRRALDVSMPVSGQ